MKKLLVSLFLGLGLAFGGLNAMAETAVETAVVVAQATTETPAAEAPAAEAPAAAEEAAAPTVDKGDVAWMLVSTILVILMVLPGLALFYGGLVRSKNMLSVLMQVMVVFS